MKQLSREEYFAQFDPSVHLQIQSQLDDPETTGGVCYQNLELRPAGELRTSHMPVGPKWTLKTLEDTGALENKLGRPIGTQPSNFIYPVNYYLKDAEQIRA